MPRVGPALPRPLFTAATKSGMVAGSRPRRTTPSMTYFVSLKIVSILLGLLYLATHLIAALMPGRVGANVRFLSNNHPLGIILMLAATIWFVVLTGVMDLGEISNMRIQLMSVWTISGVLVAIFVPGFLPIRGLGCLLLLAAALLLDAAFLVLTPWRFVVTILAYVWVIAGMIMVYSPHLGRSWLDFATRTPSRLRAFAWPGVIFGVVLIVLGIFVYPS